MAIQLTQPGIESLQALQDGAEQMRALPQFGRLAQMIQTIHDVPADHFPHAVYTVDLQDLATGKGLAAARLVGHRYFTQTPDGTNFAIEVHQDPVTAKHQFAEVGRGRFVDGVQKILNDPAFQKLVSGEAFTVSMLRINALGIHALWLHAEASQTDTMIGVPLTPPHFQPWPRSYGFDEFQDAVRDAAREKLQTDPAEFI